MWVNIFSVNYQYVDNTMISLYSALIHNPFGIACSNFTSYLFNIPLMTVAQLDYRTDFKNNNDFHFGLARYHGDNHNNFHFGLSYDYEIITINDSKANLDYLSHKFNSTWTYKRTTLFMGYGYSEKDKMYYNGLLSSISFDFPKIDVSLFTRLNYWFDYLEYSVDIYKGIPTTNINLSAGYRQIDDINEINIKISYEIRH